MSQHHVLLVPTFIKKNYALGAEMIQASTENETRAVAEPTPVKEMTPDEIRERIVELGFGGDRERFEKFCEMLRKELPEGTAVALRGSVVTGTRWEDGAPFDAKGKGTSDLDVTLIGDQVMRCWTEDAFYIPELHTKPLGDKEPHLSPTLNPIREKLQALARRPVNVQATNNWVLYVRDVLLGQPYFVIVEPNHAAPTAEL